MTDSIANALIGAVGAIIIAMIRRSYNLSKKTHDAVNGRVDQLLELARKDGIAQGREMEKADAENNRMD